MQNPAEESHPVFKLVNCGLNGPLPALTAEQPMHSVLSDLRKDFFDDSRDLMLIKSWEMFLLIRKIKYNSKTWT